MTKELAPLPPIEHGPLDTRTRTDMVRKILGQGVKLSEYRVLADIMDAKAQLHQRDAGMARNPGIAHSHTLQAACYANCVRMLRAIGEPVRSTK